MSIIGKSLLATGAAALLLSVGAVSSAQAGGKNHMHMGHHHHHFHGFGPRIYIGDFGGGGCGYYKRMWWRTGSYFWKAKYYECISY